MSQEKYASNVVEKCLTYGGPDERKLLVNEILGSTDENEPLQVGVMIVNYKPLSNPFLFTENHTFAGYDEGSFW